MVSVFFFKQKTAYEIKECDWSSDVCSSDLIHVAQMAGVPLAVIQRANEILLSLDSGSVAVARDKISEPASGFDQNQLNLFAEQERRIRDKLQAVDVNHLTPLDALNLLHELTREIKP